MKRIVTIAVVLAGLSAIAFAGTSTCGTVLNPAPCPSAPEVGDVGLASGALILVGGAVLLVRSRLRR